MIELYNIEFYELHEDLFVNSEEVLYEINDKLIQLPRIFIVSAGLPNFTQYRCVFALFFSLSLSPLNCSFSLKKNQLKLLLTSCINQIINWSEIPVRGPLSLEPLLSRWELTFECTVCTWNETYVTVVSFTEIISVIDMTYFLSRKMTKSYHLIW